MVDARALPPGARGLHIQGMHALGVVCLIALLLFPADRLSAAPPPPSPASGPPREAPLPPPVLHPCQAPTPQKPLPAANTGINWKYRQDGSSYRTEPEWLTYARYARWACAWWAGTRCSKGPSTPLRKNGTRRPENAMRTSRRPFMDSSASSSVPCHRRPGGCVCLPVRPVKCLRKGPEASWHASSSCLARTVTASMSTSSSF